MKVLHILYQSLPNISGSSTRSNSILLSQLNHGMDVIAISSPFQEGLNVNHNFEDVNGVKIYRTYNHNKKFALTTSKSLFTRFKKLISIFGFIKAVYVLSKSEKVDVLHSHATFYCAFSGIIASKLLGIPHVYEVRSDWTTNSNYLANNTIKKLLGAIEKIAVYMSTEVIVISQGLYDKYKNVNSKLHIVKNAVDDALLQENCNLHYSVNTPLNIGYIGSVIKLEGIDFLIDSMSLLPSKEVNLHIIGGGNHLDELKNKIKKMSLHNVFFYGFVNPTDIHGYYSLLDVVVNYRRDEPVAHSVTPLKPLEAMAYKKLVIVSDVKGMTELVSHNVNGIVVPAENPIKLADCFLEIIKHPSKFSDIANSGYEYVKQNKTWSKNALAYANIYTKLLSK